MLEKCFAALVTVFRDLSEKSRWVSKSSSSCSDLRAQTFNATEMLLTGDPQDDPQYAGSEFREGRPRRRPGGRVERPKVGRWDTCEDMMRPPGTAVTAGQCVRFRKGNVASGVDTATLNPFSHSEHETRLRQMWVMTLQRVRERDVFF